MLGGIVENSGLSYATVSFMIAVGQLVFGIAQPLFGVVALKRSNSFVLRCGALLMAAGLMGIPFCKASPLLMLCLGIILPCGTGALSFGIVMGIVTPEAGEKRASVVSGLVNASSGVCSTVLAPIIQALLALCGLLGAMVFLTIPSLLLLPVSLFFCREDKKSAASPEHTDTRAMFVEAIQNRTFRMLMAGFFTCGFHMAIVETHLYTQITTYGYSARTAAYAFSVYGIAAVIGSVLSGIACGRYRMQRVVGTLYGLRFLFVVLFLILPKNLPLILLFVIILGLTGNSTVPPTSGLVGKVFGAAKLAALFGVVFLCHQVGSFLSAWFGGICLAATGGYVLIWCADAALCAFASAVSFSIKESK